MMKTLFAWLDAHPSIYWWLGGIATAAMAGWIWRMCFRPRTPGRAWDKGDLVAAALLFLVLLAGRWPYLLETTFVGHAEAQLVAGALGLARDPIPFHSVDPGENGFLAAWALLPTHWLGIPQDYFNARLVALLLDWATLAVGYGYLRRFLAGGDALPILLPLALVVAASRLPGLHEYSAWHLVWFLTAWAGSRLVRLGDENRPAGRGEWIVTGLALGLIPWGHREAVVVAAAVWLIGALMVWWSSPPGSRSRRFIVQAGGLALYGDVAVMCLLHGIGQDERFWASYVCGETAAPMTAPAHAGSSVWLGCLAASVLMLALPARYQRVPRWLKAIALALAGGVFAGHLWQGPPDMFGRFALSWKQPRSELGARIRAIQQPGDTLVVWGWRPQLYVETGMPPAVASATSLGEILGSDRWRDVYRSRYLLEFHQASPVFFVDAGTPDLVDHAERAQSGHEIFPELAGLIESSYRMVSDDGRTRLYFRSGRKTMEADDHAPEARLKLSKVRVLQSLGALTEMDKGYWFAHAPSRLAYPVDPAAIQLRGVYGFLDSAYANPTEATDGATFVIEALGADGRRVPLLERRLDPMANSADRGSIPFEISLPRGLLKEIFFRIDPGVNNRCDWTYWGDLQFKRVPR